MERFELLLRIAAQWLILPIEALAASIIAAGVVVAFVRLIRIRAMPDLDMFQRVRHHFARYLVLALEFQLAADILGTAVSPSWDQIGKLGAIAGIRTFLNLVLVHEIKEGNPPARLD
ncbi:MAG: DUF1622 domain-containing protein [Desulfomonilia bacterium]|jgi:uncharacterized membrane protein